MNERSIFLAALEITDPAKRKEYIRDACASNKSLRKQVEELLAAYEKPGEFLETPILKQLGDEQTSDMPHNAPDEIDLSFLENSTVTDSLGRLGQYEIREVIGRGGCGIVLKAFDPKLERIVAIKVMAPELATTSPARKRFLREARATAALNHENVVRIHAIESRPLPFLVMEFIDGETLQQKINRTGPLDIPEVFRIALQMSDGLMAAHQKGLIHRDIKPANILIDKGTGLLKLTDFGLARTADDASMTQSGVIAGTPLYMSPEQAQGQRIDHRSDLFSFGSVLYYICCGRPPFRARSTLAVLKRVVEDEPRPISEIIPEVPDGLISLINRLHAKAPSQRFGSAQEIHDLLERCLEDYQRGGTGITIIEPTQSMVRPPAKRSWITAVAVILVLLTGLGLSESSGITSVSSTVIHLFYPQGTLVVEVDDPSVNITLNGTEMVITGAGANEIRLTPGQYELRAHKAGKLVRQELVNVTKNGRQVVRVSQETTAVKPSQPEEPHPPIAPQPKQPSPTAPVLTQLKRDSIPWETLTLAGNGNPESAPATLVAALGRPGPIHEVNIYWLSYSPDGKWLASAEQNGTIFLRDASTGAVQRILKTDDVWPTSLSFTPDSKTLAVSERLGKVTLWPLDEQQKPQVLKLGLMWMHVAISPDSRFLAAAGMHGKVRLFKWGQWDKFEELPSEEHRKPWQIKFSPNGKLLAVSWLDYSEDNLVSVYDTEQKTRLHQFKAHRPATTGLAFSADNKYLATSGAAEIRLWNLATGKYDKFGPHAYSLDFDPSGKWLAAGSPHRGIEIFSVPDGKSTGPLIRDNTDIAFVGRQFATFSPDGKTLAVGFRSGAVCLYDTESWQQKTETQIPGHHAAVQGLALAQDSRTLLSLGADRRLLRWDLKHPEQSQLLDQSHSPWKHLAINPDGNSFAVAGTTLSVRNINDDQELFSLPNELTCLVYSPRGDSLFGQIKGQQDICQWDAHTGEVIYRFSSLQAYALAVSNDGSLLAAVGADQKAILWHIPSGRKRTSWKTSNKARSITFSPDGKTLAIGDEKGIISYTDTETGESLRDFKAHSGTVTSLKYTPDGQTLVSAGTDGMIQIRNPDWNRPRAEIQVALSAKHAPIIFDIDPSGRYLFVSGPTQLIYVHKLPLDDLPNE